MSSKLGTIVKFEITRAIKKRAFWVAALILPVLLVGVIALSTVNSQPDLAATDLADKRIGILNESGIKLAQNGWAVLDSRDTGIGQVTTDKLDIFYFIPADLTAEKITVYTNSAKLMEDFSGGLKALLLESVSADLSANQIAVMTGALQTESINFVEGEEKNSLSDIILPLAVVVIIYILIVMFGNQNLTSMTEEKENRVTEMLLTSVEPSTFIWGKVVSLVALGFLQVTIMLAPVIIASFAMQGAVVFGIPLGEIVNQINWAVPVIAACLTVLVLGIILLTELLMVMGLLMPTAKDANRMFGVVIILMFLPFFFMNSFIATSPDMMARALTLFPFSAPIAIPLRMAFGNLEVWEFAASAVLMAVFIVVLMRLAVRIFKFGALEYDKKVSIKSLLQRK